MPQSPKQRYENDASYKQLCDLIENFLIQARFTPSEVRECAVMACIHFEMRYGLTYYLQSVPSQVNDAFTTLSDYRKDGDYAPKQGECEWVLNERKDEWKTACGKSVLSTMKASGKFCSYCARTISYEESESKSK